MEESNSIALAMSESLPSASNVEVQNHVCVNTMQYDEQYQDLNKASCEHTTHVHNVKTADFVENESLSNYVEDSQHHFVNELLMRSSEDDNDDVEPSITNPDIEMYDRNVEIETEVESVSTNTMDTDCNENNQASSVMDELEEYKKDKFDVQTLGYELQVGYKILMSLMGAGNRFVNKLFLHPVDDKFPETSEYYAKIKEPMWMHKMKQKFEDLSYTDLTEFMADFKLMIENCYRFNGPDNFVSKKAQKLETMMKQKIALLSKDLRAKLMGSSSSEDEVLASAGIRRRIRNPNLAAEDESQVLLSQLRRDKAIQDREDRRQRVEDRKALEAARIQEIQNWEDEFIGEEIVEYLRTMWELPQIGLFVYLCMECLGLDEEVTQYQLERGLVAPRECSDFRRLMTCLLSTQNQRKSVKSYMPYCVWNKKLSQKLDHFYKVLSDCGGNHQQACYKLGFDNRAFKVMGKTNPLLKKQFHQLSFLKRVWVLKSFCDFCVESQSYLQKTIEETEVERPGDVREVLLGSDGRGYRYINFPMFTGKDIRIYRHPKLQEPSLNSLGMEDWSMLDDKPSASSSRCSTPVNQKRYMEPQSSSLRARAILQAAESNDPSPVRASPDLMHDENSNSNQGPSSVSSETNASKGTSSSSSYRKRKRAGYTGRRKRLKNNSASRKELLMMDELTDSPGTATEKEEDAGSVRDEDNDDSQGFNVPKFNSVKDIGSDKTCDNVTKTSDSGRNVDTCGSNISCDNDGDSRSSKQTLSPCKMADSNSEQSTVVSSSDCLSSSNPCNSVTSSANNRESSSSSVAENGCIRNNGDVGSDGLQTVANGVETSMGGEKTQEGENKDSSTSVNDEQEVGNQNGGSIRETKGKVEETPGDGKRIDGKKDISERDRGNSLSDKCVNGDDKTNVESSSGETDNSSNVNSNQDSAYESEKSFQNKEVDRETSLEEESSSGKSDVPSLKAGADDKEMIPKVEECSDVKNEIKVENCNWDVEMKCDTGAVNRESKFSTEAGDAKCGNVSSPNVKKEEIGEIKNSSINLKSEEVSKSEEETSGQEEKQQEQKEDLKMESGEGLVKEEEPIAEEESDEEDLPDLGRIELVAESMEGIRNLMNKLSNPEPIKRGKRTYPGVVKPCEEELLENLTRFHDELLKYEKSLFNARVHAQIKLRKEVDSYVEPKVEESKGWESETSQSSKNASDDEEEADGGSDTPSNKNKKEKPQKASSLSSSSASKKSRKSMTDFLSSAATKLATLDGDANNEDSNDSYELDISSRGRLRKRRVIPNNTEDTLLKKRKNISQDLLTSTASPTTISTITTTTTATATLTTLPLSSSPSSLTASVNSPSLASIHNLNQSQILSMLASSQSNLALTGNKSNPNMPCQIVRFISPGGDASSYKTVRFISPGAGGKPNVILASPEKLAGASANIQFVSSTGIVTIPRSKLLASSLTSTTQSSHPVIQNLLKGQGKNTTNKVVFQKNLNLPASASGIKLQGGEQQQLLSKMLSSNIRMTNSQVVGAAAIPGIVSQGKQQQQQQQQKQQQQSGATLKSVMSSSSAASAAVVVTQVPNSFISQGGKQVLDLGSLSVTQIQQLVKNQAIQINTGAGNSTTLLLTTGLQQLSAAAASSKSGAVNVSSAGVATTTLASAGAVGSVKFGGVQHHQVKVPVPNIAGYSNTAMLGKGFSGQHMTVIPKQNVNSNSKNSPQQSLPVIRTIINQPALNAVRTTLSSSVPAVIGPNISMISLGNHQQQQMPGLFTIVSGTGATALKQIPTGTQGIFGTNNPTTNQTSIGLPSSSASPASLISQNSNIIPTVNLNTQQQQQQLFTIVSGSGAALKQIPAPRIISSLNQNVLIAASSSSSQGPNNAINPSNISLSNKENPLSTSNSVVTHSNNKSPLSSAAQTTPSDPQKHNWVTIPTKKYAGSVTVKALLENRNATKKTESDLSNINNSSSSSSSSSGDNRDKADIGNSTQNSDSIQHSEAKVNVTNASSNNAKESLIVNSTLMSSHPQGIPLSSPTVSCSDQEANASKYQDEDMKELSSVAPSSSSSSVPVTQSLSVDAAIQPLLVSSYQVTLPPTVNIKVPSPNTLPSLTHNKHSTTIVQSTKAPIPVATTVDSNLSPVTQITNATSSITADGMSGLPSLPQTPTNQLANSNTFITPTSSNSNPIPLNTPKSHTQTQMVLNMNNNLNIINNASLNSNNSANGNPADLKNVMLKLTPPKGGTGQFVQGYMTAQGKLVIPQAALFPQQQQQQQQNQQQAQVLQAGPTRVILANNNALSQSNQILHTAKIPSALISGNNGSPQVRIVTPNNNNNNNTHNVLTTNNQAPTGVQILGQPSSQLVLSANAATAQRSGVAQNFQQPSNSASLGSLTARAVPVQSGNPGIKLMLINPSAVPGLQNNPIQTIQQQQQHLVNRSTGNTSGSASVVVSSDAQQNQQQAIETTTPASELVKQIAANSTQLKAASTATGQQQQSGIVGNNPTLGKSVQHIAQQANNTLSSQGHVSGNPRQTNSMVSPLAAQILTLQQQGNKIQPQQIQGGQIVIAKPQQQQPTQQNTQQQSRAISLQLQNLNQILSSQGVNLRNLGAQQIQVPNSQLQQQAGVSKQIPQAQMLQLAINAQTANSGAGTVVAQPRVVQVAGQLSPQIQLPNQSPLQATVVPQLIIQQQQPTTLLQPGKQLIGAPPGSNLVQLQQNNTVIQQQPKAVVAQPQQQQSGASPSIGIQQQPKHPQLLTKSQVGRQQQQQQHQALNVPNANQIQVQNQSQAQIQFVINPSAASTSNLTRLAKPVIHPVIKAVATSPSSLPTAPLSGNTNMTTSLKSPSSSSATARPQQIILSQSLQQPPTASQSISSLPSSSSNQFIISPIKLGTPQNPQGTPQTRLLTPLKLVTPMQTILQQAGTSSLAPLTDQRTSQLVMQNTSQLHNVLQSNNPDNKFVAPALSHLLQSTSITPTISTSSLADCNKIMNNSSLHPSSSLDLNNQNVIVSSATLTRASPLSQSTLVVASVNGTDNNYVSSSKISLDNTSGPSEQNGIGNNRTGIDELVTGVKQQQTIRRNTFCGSQEVAKLARTQRQKSADESMASEDNDEKEAALNLLTLANQPLQ